MIGSLSLLARQPLPGYEPLPDFPEEQPDSSVRDNDELEGWSGSRTTIMETGFGSDSFEYRSRPSTALSGIEAIGSSSMYPVAAKKKGNEYDLDAFYDEASEEEESSNEESSSEDETEDDTEDDTEESEEEETESEEEEESSEEEEEILHHQKKRF
ncbi:hypothetical protein RMCBS344292_16498 [Rhizopus microsporus]|jgi:AP-3 complex subunit beta|nr:hypothetical protein RMCBS344292_16498 [Rhizopus microsporus]